jgi:hypothetical protein
MPGNPDNLKPNTERTPEERRDLAIKAGKASGRARREKKVMTQIYADFLSKKHDVKGKDGIIKKMKGEDLLSGVMSKILSRGDSSSVALMKEIRQAIEGENFNLNGSLIVYLDKQDEGL